MAYCTRFEARETNNGDWQVVMLEWAGPDDDEPRETVVEDGIEEVEAEDEAEYRNECAMDAFYDRMDPEFDRSGGHY